MHDSDYYEVGQSVYFWALLKNRFKAPVDPVDLELHIKPPAPAAVIVVPLAQLVHEATGRFSYTYTMTAQGLWSYAFHSDNPDDVDGDRFHVSNSSHP
jgi:hypothetical protein